MIRVAHVLPGMSVGGTEQMVLELCRHRDRSCFESVVAAPTEGVIANEIRETGTPVYTGPASVRAAAHHADLINLHWLGYDPALLAQVQAEGKPYVTALQVAVVLPWIPALTICSSEHAFQIQEHPNRCVVIPNGVDVSRFSPQRKPRREEIILTRVCRPPKCAIYFWEAMKQVLDRFPQTRLWIVGNPDSCRTDSNRINFLGVRRDIPQILAETDIFVYTPYPGAGSLDLVPMEASAAGVPCVLSDVSAVRPLVDQGKNGFLTPYGDVDAFVDKVSLLIQDADLRARMSRMAIQIARERFDIRAVVRRYEVVYRIVLEAYQSLPPAALS
jgi:glycosyltransferase involved in cell wall biosynthesis